MRLVLQRVKCAEVRVEGGPVARIGPGLLVLAGVKGQETEADLGWLAEKCAHLRIFEDEAGKMNRSLLEVGGELLLVPEFTLYGDCRQGRRPSLAGAAPPAVAAETLARLARELRRTGLPVKEGVFGASMEVELVNDGPVTFLLER